MALPHKVKLIKKEIEDLISLNEELWQEYEENKLDNLIKNEPSHEVFDLGWVLGKVDAWQDILNFIEDMERPCE